MAVAMLNVRMDKDLKAQGERVLAKQGVSATEAIRGLYRFMEQTEEVPDFCITESEALSPDARRQKMRQMVGIAKMAPGEDLSTLKQERLSRLEVAPA